MPVPDAAQEEAHENEDAQGAAGVDGNVHHRLPLPGHGDGFGKMPQFLEGIAQQNEGHDFQLFAHGTGKGTGNAEDQPHDFHAQNDGEGQMDGPDVAVGRETGQLRRQQAQTFGLDDQQGTQIGQQGHGGYQALGGRPLPPVVEEVVDVGKYLQPVPESHVCLAEKREAQELPEYTPARGKVKMSTLSGACGLPSALLERI